MSLHYVHKQLQIAEEYLRDRGQSPALDAVRRAREAFPRIVALVIELKSELQRKIDENPSEIDIQAALNFGTTAEQHLKGGDPRG